MPSGALDGLCPKCLIHFSAGTLRYFGDYELLEEIARGGMGVVYKARQVSLDRVVAVKMILSGQFASDEFKRRFRTEARTAASLQHPNIVPVHEVGEQDGFQYFSMDYIEGRSLAALVREHPLPADRAAHYVKTIAEAVHYAHQQGALHRDLKPSNVLIDSSGQPHLTDFGLAKLITSDSELTTTGQVLGSPNYIPPEQAEGHLGHIGAASDVYSLGAILYHLLTGRPPFLAHTVQNTLSQVVKKDPVEPRLLNPSVPRDLETICLKCMQKDSHRRYQTAQELADELDRFLRDKPILARPISRVEKVWRWCRREPAIASLVGTAAVLLVLGTSLVLWQWRKAEHQRHLAEANAEQNRRFLYVRDMATAFTEWNEGDLAPVTMLLGNQKPKPGQTDLRGFEWRHLWWLGHRDSVLTLPERKQVAGSMAFSPDGKSLAAYYWDDTLRLWNLDSPRHELQIFTNAAALGGFVDNGDLYVVGTRDGSIKLCQTKSGKVVRAFDRAGELLAVAPNAKLAVAIDRAETLKILDLTTGTLNFSKPGVVHRRSDYSWGSTLAISADGKLLALTRPSKGAHRFDEGVELWNTETGNDFPFLKDPRQIRCLLFSPDGKTLAVGAGDGSVVLWDLRDGPDTPAHRITLEGHGLPIHALAFSPDGRTLAGGGSLETIQLWDVATGRSKPRAFRGPIGDIWSLAFSPDGQRLATGGRNSALKLWNVAENPIFDSSEELASEDWGNFTFSPDSKLMAAACKGNRAKVWDVQTFEVIATLPGASYVVAFSQDGKDLLVSTSDRTPLWWNLPANTNRIIPGRNMAGVISADLSPDRRLAVLGHEDGTIQLLDLDSGQDLKVWHGHQGAVRSVRFSPRGDKLVSGGRDRSVTVWDVATQKNLGSSAEHRGAVCALAFSYDGEMMASACGADMIKLWKPSDLSKALASIPNHKAEIRTLDFSPDRKTLASGSEDKTVRLFNVALNQEIATFAMDSGVRLVLFSPDGNTLAIVTDGGKLQLLRATSLERADAEELVLK